MDSLDRIAKDVFEILGEAGIPAEIIGGYAMSNYNYVRNTTGIDVVVPSDLHSQALETLKNRGFTEDGRLWFKLHDPGVPDKSVDILPSGKHLSGNNIKTPTPTKVSKSPEFTELNNLVAMKVGVITTNGIGIAAERKNQADVFYLIQNNSLSRDFLSSCGAEVVEFEYQCMWDSIENEKQEGKSSNWKEQPDPFSDFLR